MKTANGTDTNAIRCEFSRCKAVVCWRSVKLFGTGGVIYTCDSHKPGNKTLPSGKTLPSFYETTVYVAR